MWTHYLTRGGLQSVFFCYFITSFYPRRACLPIKIIFRHEGPGPNAIRILLRYWNPLPSYRRAWGAKNWTHLSLNGRHSDLHLSPSENKPLLRWGNTRLFLDFLFDSGDLLEWRKKGTSKSIYEQTAHINKYWPYHPDQCQVRSKVHRDKEWKTKRSAAHLAIACIGLSEAPLSRSMSVRLNCHRHGQHHGNTSVNLP